MPPRTSTKSAETPVPPNDPNGMILGEMRGQLREMVHSVNNLSTKFDALTREVIGLGTMAADIGALKAKVEALEADKNRTDGMKGVLATALSSRAVGWLVGAGTVVWLFFTGKIHP